MFRHLIVVVLPFVILSLSACPEPPPRCPTGTESCACDSDFSCDSGLVCVAGSCEKRSCTLGQLNCACFGNSTCSATESGVQMVCTGGVCNLPACVAGEASCPCDGESCDPGLICDAETSRCAIPNCPSGDAGCTCRVDMGCNPGLACDEGVCTPFECTPGSTGCRCDQGQCHAGDAVCDEVGVCQVDGCPAGQEGCACVDGDCGHNERGEALRCQGGRCASASCTPGETGCVCSSGTDCSSANDLCVDDFCRSSGCLPGEINCACINNGCAPGLVCRDGSICVDGTGQAGGPCRSNNTCEIGNRCAAGLCEACMRGSTGCACTEDGSCNNGLECMAGLCVVEGSAGPSMPESPLCYTPCSSNLVDVDGNFHRCAADGVMDGCFGGQVCTQGSCTQPGDDPPTCQDDLACPEFQICIEGGCYSNCEINSDCVEGFVCATRVCRLACDTNGAACPEEQFCETGDGENGHCMPMSQPGQQEQVAVDGDYSLSTTTIAFSNVNTSVTLTLVNDSPRFETFKIRKLEHSALFDDGSSEIFPAPGSASDSLQHCDPTVDCPLWWIEMGEQGQTSRVQEFEIGVDGNGGHVQIEFAGAGDYSAVRWTGRFEVSSPRLPTKQITTEYFERPEGRWAGTVHYFAQFGTNQLDDWRATASSRDDSAKLDRVGNAFIKKWGAFRTGNLSWQEFQAILKATREESWRWASVRNDCPVDPAGACYLTDSSIHGLATYSNSLASRPIPTGVVELPFAVNLHQPDSSAQPGLLSGRIESALALQYAGNPAFTLDFGSDPSACERTTSDGTCLVFIDNLDDNQQPIPLAQIYVGGRYLADTSGCSQDGYVGRKEPWLLPGLRRATNIDGADGLLKRQECRDTLIPFDNGSGTLPDELIVLNKSLAASNPIPDGRTRKRSLKLVDGALINQSLLFIIFEESFESFLPNDSDTFSAYGYIVMQREAADLDLTDDNGDSVPDVYEGSVPTETRNDQPGRLDVSCSPDMIKKALDYSDSNETVHSGNVHDLVLALLTGRSSTSNVQAIAANDTEAVHYLCVDTGMFDGGRYDLPNPNINIPNNDTCGYSSQGENRYNDNGFCDDGGESSDTSICPFGTDIGDCGSRNSGQANARVACPAESEVVFFTVNPGITPVASIAGASCQVPASDASTGSCNKALLEQWKQQGIVIQRAPHWECSNRSELYCDRNRYDLREGKTFFKAATGSDRPAFNSLYADIYRAFRYKTRFRSRNGSTLGFAPEICDGASDQVPYCYDPALIEQIRERVDCMMYIWRDFRDDPALSALYVLQPGNPPVTKTSRELLDDFLCANFAYTEACHQEMDQTTIHDGFERLYTELLVMMGDESYTQAFASRFDLAGSNARSFQGSMFEDGGINLSGPAGFELYSLYQATQYYQEALDRFYSLSPMVWQAVSYGIGQPVNFVSQATVTWYFERLIRASTQKARTWSQIAQRYQNINEPGLARRVVERAYTSTYLESIVLARLMQSITRALAPDDIPAVVAEIEKAQRRYRMALLDMRNVYSAITEDINYFGFSPDYIPFPTLSAQVDNSAFEVIMTRAKSKVLIAKERENDALNRNRAFETDAEEFQAELVKLRTNYENQLGDVCGTFAASDGRIYPAISTYADLDENTRRIGDPCGTVGNGSITQAMGQYESYLVDLQRIRQSFDNVLEEIEIERSRASAQCGLIMSIAKYNYDWGQRRANLAVTVSLARATIAQIDRTIGYTGTMASLSKCFMIAGTSVGSNCPAAAVTTTIFSVASAVGGLAIAVLDIGIAAAERGMSEIDLSTARWETERQCDAALIDSNARMATLALRLREIQLEALRAQYTVQLASADIQRQLNLAKRLEQELGESEQFAINIQAARNDPNVRIYRNDAYLNADLSFKDALREAYRATKVYEYYTSQSYAKLEQLFLIRMIQFGDYNLANYLAELENQFYIFEEEYGLPDTRVAVLSLRDDILNIPRLDDLNRPYTKTQRIDMMREALADPALLDENGYLTKGFATGFKELSPLTRNHKILYIETELIGSDIGDTVGRVYLRQQGTSVIDGLYGEKSFYRFPERLAVINPFFNGTRVFDKEVYRNNRLRERPYANTSWELVINQRDEQANKDINLQSLTDLRLYIYYTDFTQF